VLLLAPVQWSLMMFLPKPLLLAIPHVHFKYFI
jgi:hypothetical protein